MKSSLFKTGIWNTLEHFLTRALDALATLVIIRFLSPEHFGLTVFSQAFVAPFLVFFFSTEIVLYRDFGKWRDEGILLPKLQALRILSWVKIPLSLAAAGVLAVFWEAEILFSERFMLLLWAFALVLSPQFSGADREFLRLNLNLRALNLLTLIQKTALLGGTVLACLLWERPFIALGVVGGIVSVATTVSAYLLAVRFMEVKSPPVQARPGRKGEVWLLFRETFFSFSIWHHLSGIVFGTMLTLDIFFMGHGIIGPRIIGLYGTVIKIAGIALALPLALSNLFSIRIVQGGDQSERMAFLFSGFILGVTLLECLVLWAGSPYFLAWFSDGKWSPEEIRQMVAWLGPVFLGSIALSVTFPLAAWLTFKGHVKPLFLYSYLPWMVIGVAVFSVAENDWIPGSIGMIPELKLLVCLLFLPLVAIRFRGIRMKNPVEKPA